MNKILILILAAALSACGAVGTQFTKMSEPGEGARARVRISANMLVKGVPDSDCLNWNKAGAGTIFGGVIGSSGYRQRVIGMPNPYHLSAKHSGEFYVNADKPIAFQLINTPESRMRCSIAFSFVPKSGHDYDIVMLTQKVKENGALLQWFKPAYSLCSAVVLDITEKKVTPVATDSAKNCPR